MVVGVGVVMSAIVVMVLLDARGDEGVCSQKLRTDATLGERTIGSDSALTSGGGWASITTGLSRGDGAGDGLGDGVGCLDDLLDGGGGGGRLRARVSGEWDRLRTCRPPGLGLSARVAWRGRAVVCVSSTGVPSNAPP